DDHRPGGTAARPPGADAAGRGLLALGRPRELPLLAAGQRSARPVRLDATAPPRRWPDRHRRAGAATGARPAANAPARGAGPPRAPGPPGASGRAAAAPPPGRDDARTPAPEVLRRGGRGATGTPRPPGRAPCAVQHRGDLPGGARYADAGLDLAPPLA